MSSRDDFETAPGPLSESGRPFHRRSTEQKLENIANSALLKVIQYAITAIMVPGLFWMANALLDRMAKIEDAIQKNNTVAATNELRMGNLERSQSDRDAQIKNLSEKAIILEYELRSLMQKR